MLPPTKWEIRCRALMYLFTALVGVWVLAFPRHSNLSEVLGWVTLVWSLFMGTALVASYATLRGKYLIEFAALPVFTFALLVAVLVTWAAAISGDTNLLPRVSASTALLFGFALRMVVLWHIVEAPVSKGKEWTPTS